ncbi:uncharacterized protein IL334_001351 [Kwoniella shivajii]|uniref:Endonuclease/exonuclease/phosphatase domain-containing protein n=1 Tax=Kwoniella shivajii TaxID=564305 RepID=A0ABZ1CRN3_9TREE|nr:hypothetical protein IL334_001351 [Kwoniella shivajii]
MPAPANLTPEQIAKAADRKAAKLAKKQAVADGSVELGDAQKLEIERKKFLKREWRLIGRDSEGTQVKEQGKSKARIVTWNVLAQTLVRRELFPGSDCLRWSDRKSMLLAELEHHSLSDIICLQECDRVKEYSTSLPQHIPIQGSGPGKLHGLVIFYRKSKFFVRSQKLIHLDTEELSPSKEDSNDDEDGKRRRGGSRQTKNVSLIVALEEIDGGGRGMVVATTHLFWHPKYAYERVRQSIIILRSIRQFQKDNDCTSWPCIFAGDLNTQPSEATYQLLVSPHAPLPQPMIDEITSSRLVHDSVVKVAPLSAPSEIPSTTATGSNTPITKDEEEGEGELPVSNEKSIANTRSPSTSDGILPVDQLVRGMRELLPLGGTQSAYGSTRWGSNNKESFGNRGGFDSIEDENVNGKEEPAYTCFTPLFRLTLDYLLLLPPLDDSPQGEITALYTPPKIEELGEGLPRKGICASDHLAMGCEISW